MRIALGLLASILISACGIVGRSGVAELGFDGRRALDFARWQVDQGPRIPGSESAGRTAAEIETRLRASGWIVRTQDWRYRGAGLRNVLGCRNTSAGKGVLLGAHYDTRPHADRDLTQPDAPVPGANDGASGTAVLVELARVIPEKIPDRNLCLVFFDAEDSGDQDGWDWVVGSQHFVEQLSSLPQSAVIVDMVGDADLQLYWEAGSNPDLSADIWAIGGRLGYGAFIPEARHALLDDHTPFLLAGIPAIDIIDFDYPYWHTTQDTTDKIDARSLEVVGRTLQAWLAGGA